MTRKIPVFKSEEEEAQFWDTHDSLEYLDPLESAEVTVSPELEKKLLNKREFKKPITLRLEPSQIEDVKKIANKKGLPYQTLIRMWIVEYIRKESM